ncbi:type VI secretion system baseplate subunit TssG [Chitinophaga solisilvae]|uniref:type VI secretion system baseplate subunit TssG n=1 Tax=Chitinophaga solisilvae TaxID=1233460 RepID=UPI00136BBDCB|nr:type VI secretion system baseplate subunit TssG [Chitinophaga solisilvae]
MISNAQKSAVLEEVITHVNALPYDIRAEVVVGELLDNHVRLEEVVVELENVFARSFNRDILHAELDESQPYQPFVVLSLSRDGIYDRLPEGMFHDFTQQEKKGSGTTEMVARYKRQQQQELQARRFFQPLEHEFFLQRVFLEQREKHLLFDVFGKDADQLFHAFWNLPAGLPGQAAGRLVKLLPYMHRIAGNLSLVQLCLQMILEEPVQIAMDHTPQPVQAATGTLLGECLLGVDTMAGEVFYSDMPRIIVTIGPLQHQRIVSFLAWNPYGRLLETCYGYFFPADATVQTVLEPHPDEKSVTVSDRKTGEGIMGYNFFL